MECEKCNGTGWVNTWCHGHDVMLKEQCYDCMAHERDKKDLMTELSKIVVNSSKQRMAMVLAGLLVDYTDKYCAGDFSNIEALVKTKDMEGIFMSISMM